MYKDTPHTLSFSISKHLDYSVPILFRPYYAKASKGMPASAALKPATIKPAPMAKTPVQKKAPTVMAAVVKPEIKTTPAPIVKKEVAKVEPQKPTPVPIKTEVAKIEPKPTPIKKEVAKLPFDTPPLAALPPSPRLRSAGRANGEGKEAVPLIPKNAYVSDNYREVEALRRQAQLQNEIVKCWKPPFGTSADCACDISFSVNATGGLHDIKVTKSSGVVMYDISARQALYAMNMPKWTYGKQLIINFNPPSYKTSEGRGNKINKN